jgi:ComF family protein
MAARIGRFALDLLLPARCLSCGELVAEPGALCAACWPKVRFLTAPHCAICGYPFEFDAGHDAVCASCARGRPAFERARAALRYDEGSARLVVALKHADRTDAAPTYGAWMARAGAELLADADVLVPVPLHRLRLLLRRYNQSALLAHALGRVAARPVAPDALQRTRWTRSQGRMNRRLRSANVRGAFAVRRGREALIEGRKVVLVDDVLTTGATVTECTKALYRAGAARVDVLTLARVVRPL